MTSNTRASVMDDLTPGDSRESQPTIEQLVDRQLEGFKAALANQVATQFQHQERLLEEARHDLALHKEASERVKHDLLERFERERQALNDEIRRLERIAHAYEERFRQEKKALGDGIFELKAIGNPKKRAEYQKKSPSTLANAEQHVMGGEGILAM